MKLSHLVGEIEELLWDSEKNFSSRRLIAIQARTVGSFLKGRAFYLHIY